MAVTGKSCRHLNEVPPSTFASARRRLLRFIAVAPVWAACGGRKNKIMSVPSRMPVGFIGHGAPTVALDENKGAPWRAWGAALPTPKAVVVVSAHWEDAPVVLGTSQVRPLIYDFYGFPEALYQVKYRAPGAPSALVERVQALLDNPTVQEDRGWDHGVWTPMVHLFPQAHVPVLQVSLPSGSPANPAASAAAVWNLGERLAPLRDEGVFLLGSGNVTHNLRRMRPDGSEPEPFAAEFDAWVREQIVSKNGDGLIDAANKAPGFRLNHPTTEHWLPLVFSAAAAGKGDPSFKLEAFEYGNLSRRAVEWS